MNAGQRRGHYEFPQNLPLTRAHRLQKQHLVFIRRHKSVQHIQNRHDQSDQDRHEYDGFASRSAPNDDQGTERYFRQRVQDDEIWLRDLTENLAPPKQQRDPDTPPPPR